MPNSIRGNLLLKTSYSQQIMYLADVVQAIAEGFAQLHKSHEQLCKYVYKGWFGLCVACKHEHEKEKHVEKCEKCGSAQIALVFPGSERVPGGDKISDTAASSDK